MRRLFPSLPFLLINLTLAIWFPLIPNIPPPLKDLRILSPSLVKGFLYVCLISLAFLIQALALRRHPTKSFPKALIETAVATLPLIFVYPINANDIFRYWLRGRLFVRDRISPFVTPLGESGDPTVFNYAGEWVKETTPYGPLWELVDALAYALSQDSIIIGLILLKTIGWLLTLLCSLAIYSVATKNRTKSALLWLWNPAIWLMFIVDGHNDVAMLLFLVLAYKFFTDGRIHLVVPALALAVLVKPIALLALPYFGLASLQKAENKLRFFITSAFAGFSIALFSFIPFGLTSLTELFARLLRESQASGGFSPVVMLYLQAREANLAVSYARFTQTATLLTALLAVILIFTALTLSQKAWSIHAIYLFFSQKFRIWYPTWLFPWAILSENRRLIHATWLFLLTSQLSPFIFGHLNVLRFNIDQPLAHLIGVPFTFGIPIIYYLLSPLFQIADSSLDSDPTVK